MGRLKSDVGIAQSGFIVKVNVLMSNISSEHSIIHPGPDSDEIKYMQERRAALGGVLPRRVVRAKPLPQPPAVKPVAYVK